MSGVPSNTEDMKGDKETRAFVEVGDTPPQRYSTHVRSCNTRLIRREVVRRDYGTIISLGGTMLAIHGARG